MVRILLLKLCSYIWTSYEVFSVDKHIATDTDTCRCIAQDLAMAVSELCDNRKLLFTILDISLVSIFVCIFFYSDKNIT
jgi:hypothetical protein